VNDIEEPEELILNTDQCDESVARDVIALIEGLDCLTQRVVLRSLRERFNEAET